VCRTYWIEQAPLASRSVAAAAPAAAPEAAPSPAEAAPSPAEAAPPPPEAAPPPREAPTRDLNLLTDAFRAKVDALLERCTARGTPMRPYFTLRSPFEQARLWRQSRSKEEIAAKIAELQSQSAPFLAGCIARVGPQLGEPVTNAIPGLSWHQWGEAVDCFWVVDGEAEWSSRKKINDLNGYHVYAEEAEAAGLTAGGHWSSFKDWPHVQLRAAGSPLRLMSLIDIDKEMRQRFGP
jgi:hypothetical protein